LTQNGHFPVASGKPYNTCSGPFNRVASLYVSQASYLESLNGRFKKNGTAGSGRNQPLPDFDLRPEGDSPQPLMPSCSNLKTRRKPALARSDPPHPHDSRRKPRHPAAPTVEL